MLLKKIRKYAKKLLIIISILIIPAFVLWGAGSVLRSKDSSQYAGKIFGKKISLEEYTENWQAVKNQALMIYGQNLEKILPFLNLEKQTWDRLILLKQAKKERIKVSDKEIAEIISSMPFFQQNNKFDKQTYDTILKYVFSTSAKTFETQIKDSLAIEKLISKTLEKVNVSEEELIQAYKKENETVNVSYVLFDPQKYADNVKINEEILQNYFKKHKNNFKEPAKVTFRYIQVPFDDSSDNSKVSSEEIEIYFNENKESFAEEGQETDQIKLTKDIRKKIKTAIIKYKNRLKAKNVAELISDFLLKNPDIEKASKHFSLKLQNTGFFSQYEPIPTIGLSFALTQKAFSLEPKTISNALEIKDKGIFFIEVTDKKEPYIPDFKQAEKKIEEVYKNTQSKMLAKQAAEEALKQIQQVAGENTKADTLFSGLNLETKTTGFFKRTSYIPDIGQSKAFITASFNTPVNQVSSQVVATKKGYCLLIPEDKKSIDQIPGKEEKETFKQKYVLSKKQLYYNQWMNQIRTKANLQNNLEKLRKQAKNRQEQTVNTN